MMGRGKFIGMLGGMIAVASSGGCALVTEAVRWTERQEFRELKSLSKFRYRIDIKQNGNREEEYHFSHHSYGVVIPRGKHRFMWHKQHVVDHRRIPGGQSDVYLNGVKLEEVLRDAPYDIAIFRLPKVTALDNVKDWPTLIADDVELGDRVGIMGHPEMRKNLQIGIGRVINPLGEPEHQKGVFVAEGQVIPGYSGEIVMKIKDNTLCGLVDAYKHSHAYITHSREYLKRTPLK